MVLLAPSTQPSVGVSGTPSGNVAVPPEPPPDPGLPPELLPATAIGPERVSSLLPPSQPMFATRRIERPNRERIVVAIARSLVGVGGTVGDREEVISDTP